MCKKYCSDKIDIKLIFQSVKISSFFSTKDIISDSLKSNVVYEFKCGGCNSTYIGQTTRHFATRIKEHLHSDKNSHVFKHLKENKRCEENSNIDCFSILDNGHTKYELMIKEGMYI